jgi:hypothetical protein
MQACSVVLRTPRCGRRTSGSGKAEWSNLPSALQPRHFRPPPSSRWPPRSAASGLPGIIRATAKQPPAMSITPDERVPSFRAFDISSPSWAALPERIRWLAAILIVFTINVPGKEGAHIGKIRARDRSFIAFGNARSAPDFEGTTSACVHRQNKVNRMQMHPSGTGSTTRMAKPSAPDLVVHLAIEITAPLMRFLYG